MKAERWEETDRHPIGFQVGHGRGKTMPWFSVLYRVTEVQRKRGRVVAYRERVLYGRALSISTAKHPEAALGSLLAIVADGAGVLSRYAEAEHATSRRKAR